jgi:hypothetical protein
VKLNATGAGNVQPSTKRQAVIVTVYAVLLTNGLVGVAVTTVLFCDHDNVYTKSGATEPVRLSGVAGRSKVMLIVALVETFTAPADGFVLSMCGGFIRQGQPPIQEIASTATHTKHVAENLGDMPHLLRCTHVYVNTALVFS